MIEKSWYQVKNVENAEMYHKGERLKPKQLIYLTEDQASLHNQDSENLIQVDKPKSILDVAFSEEFNEWNDSKNASLLLESVEGVVEPKEKNQEENVNRKSRSVR
jgi:hypothetical protein